MSGSALTDGFSPGSASDIVVVRVPRADHNPVITELKELVAMPSAMIKQAALPCRVSLKDFADDTTSYRSGKFEARELLLHASKCRIFDIMQWLVASHRNLTIDD